MQKCSTLALRQRSAIFGVRVRPESRLDNSEVLATALEGLASPIGMRLRWRTTSSNRSRAWPLGRGGANDPSISGNNAFVVCTVRRCFVPMNR